MKKRKNQSEITVLFFDGYCVLCNRWANWVMDYDPEGRIYLAPLQSDAARKCLIDFGKNPDVVDSVLFLDNGKLYDESDAVLKMAGYLKGRFRLLWLGYLLPKTLRDRLYRLFAKNRYRWFGKRTHCRIPKPDEIRRFLR